MSRHLSTLPGVLADLRRQRWLPVLRCADADDAVATSLSLRDGGCSVVELTYSTPDVASAVRRLVAEGLTVGVGTVRTAGDVVDVVEAGATFVVSFARPPDVVQAALSLGIVPIPGALTPHEVMGCLDGGAPAVKIFPARLVSPGYLGDLHAVLGDVPLVVTGGVPAETTAIDRWIEAGAWCVGVGSSLGTVSSVGPAEVTRRATLLRSG